MRTDNSINAIDTQHHNAKHCQYSLHQDRLEGTYYIAAHDGTTPPSALASITQPDPRTLDLFPDGLSLNPHCPQDRHLAACVKGLWPLCVDQSYYRFVQGIRFLPNRAKKLLAVTVDQSQLKEIMDYVNSAR